MPGTELHALTIAELGPLLRRRALSPVELTRHYLDRIAAFDGRTNAYVTVTAEEALAQARAAEAEIMAGAYRGPLHGIPIALKDLYDTAGVRTTAASRIFAERIPDEDATTVRMLRAAGAVVLGKTNLHEWALGATNEVSYFGPTRNPWDLERVTGGSSGGSGAAVAAGLCAAATGTDTGGSIRIPGALCGLVGVKPTFGRVSCNGIIPLSWSLDHPGPIARSVYDAAVLLGGMAGWDPRDPASVDVAVPDYLATLHDGVRGLRIAVDPAYAFSSVDPEVEAAVHQALSVLEVLGAELVEVRLARLGEAHEAPLLILLAEAAAYHEDFLRTRPDDYEPDGPRLRLEQAVKIPGPEYARARRAGQWIRRDFELLFQDADLFALPTCAIPAPRFGQTDTQIRGQTQTVLASLTRFTRIFNLVGGPAITVPCGFSEGGLPVGLQLVGKHWDEATLLRVAHAYEQATGWHHRRPPFGEQR